MVSGRCGEQIGDEMAYWEDGGVHTVMALLTLLLVGVALGAGIRRLTSVAIPVTILAGVVGLVVGPGALGLIPMQVGLLGPLSITG